MPASRSFAGLLLPLLLLPGAEARPASVESVPLWVDFAPGTASHVQVPVRGGIPFPRGQLRSAEQVRLLAGRKELPAQVSRTAVWPDGSVKWILVDVVLSPNQAKSLRLEYGAKLRRAPIVDPLVAERKGGRMLLRGPGLKATVSRGGELTRLLVKGKEVLGKGGSGRLVLVASRNGKTRTAKVEVKSLELESSGPIRARAHVRGHFAVDAWGTGYPKRVLAEQPAGLIPFSLRLDFVRGLPLVIGSHQLVYTGEPDKDFILRWGFELDGQGAGRKRLIREPGLTEDRIDKDLSVDKGPTARLCWAALEDGLALIRSGFENRPCAVGGEKGGPARLDFWPAEVGKWDLRRYAREWAVGETGNRDRPDDMLRYAKHAAYGLAKSHQFVLHLGGGDARQRLERAQALAAAAILTAPPAWYASTAVLGHWAPEDRKGAFSKLEEGVRRYLDYFRFNQDLYRWYGKANYGFWQTRNGSIHRHDRWDRDYGRWGWSLGDGAGRAGHLLMFTYLRTLERRYFTEGEACVRAAFDVAMVHTKRHLENAADSWWHVQGCSHRHGVQPFSGPYIGMRGSYPYGQRILWLLTGDGAIGDGLDLVAGAALAYATKRPGAFGASGGPDGQGAGALGLLWAYEKTGEKKYLQACRRILDRSGLITSTPKANLGYGPSFGLFLAAEEYLALSGDEEFRQRFLALADNVEVAKNKRRFLTVLAAALRLTGKKKYRKALLPALAEIDVNNSLAELPRAQWPGHGGPRKAPSRANDGRDLPYVYAALEGIPKQQIWPTSVPDPVVLPVALPRDWHRPQGHQTAQDRPPDPAKLLALKPPRGDGKAKLGALQFAVEKGQLRLLHPENGNPLATIAVFAGAELEARFGCSGGRIGAASRDARRRYALRIAATKVKGHAAARVEMAVEASEPFGMVLRLELSRQPAAIHLTVPGHFRVERWRVDQNDEAIPGWLNSDSRTRWPLWRRGGLTLGNADSYRIYKANLEDTARLFVDEGFHAPGWLDLTDRGAAPAWGLSVRLLRDLENPIDDLKRSIRFDYETGELRIEFAPPAPGPWVGALDLVMHDGWRPPLGKPELSRAQYMAFLDDLDYGGNIGLFALRFLLSETHQVGPGKWKQRLADRGIEARELLLSMLWRDGLKKHCKRIGLPYDAANPDVTVGKILAHYRRR